MKKIFLTIILFLFTPFFVYANEEINLAITPPLIELNILPGEEMKTAIKVVNNSKEKTIISVKVRDFENDENNKIKFFNESDVDLRSEVDRKSLLSQWISFREDSLIIDPFQSKNVVFNIKVPEDASPGGYYAAILVGNDGNKKKSGTNVSISSYLSSLILLNIKGDIVEKGEIRDFSTENYFYKEPNVNFEVSFKNRGNVHLHPEGDIKIYDFWNNNVGNISINKNTSFGNVLPDSIKKWEFNWSQEMSISKMGRYTAKLALVFGGEAKRSDYREVNFWVIDFKLVSYIVISLVFIILLFILFVKFSIKRSIDKIKMEVNEYNYKYKKKSYQPKLIKNKKMIDLRKKNKE